MTTPQEEEEEEEQQQGLCASAAERPVSQASSFGSLDVRIWEELHLKSSLSSLTVTSCSQQDEYASASPARKVSNSGLQGFPSAATLSHFPHRLCNGGTNPAHPSGKRDFDQCSRLLTSNALSEAREAEPPPAGHDRLPVVNVIQRGSMSFTSQELVVQARSYSLAQEKAEDTGYSLAGEIERIASVGSAASKAKLLLSYVYSAPIAESKRELCGAVPFKWEETPGKPKQCSDYSGEINANASLNLPPRLQLCNSSVAICSPSTPSISRNQVQHHQHRNCATPIRSFHEYPAAASPSAARPKNLWHSFIQSGRRSYREDGAKAARMWEDLVREEERPSWSPTSILLGPEDKRPRSASSTPDALCSSPGLGEMQRSLNGDGQTPSPSGGSSSAQHPVPSVEETSSLLRYPIPDFGPPTSAKKKGGAARSFRDFLRSCKNLGKIGSPKKGNHRETEIWEPTLATYIHSMELERSSSVNIHDCSCQYDQQYPLQLKAAIAGLQNPYPSDMPAAMTEQSGLAVYESDALKHDDDEAAAGICAELPVIIPDAFSHNSCLSPEPLLRGPLGHHKEHRRRKQKKTVVRRRVRTGQGWVLRKLKRSSRVMFAIWRAVARSAGSIASSRGSKRQKLPYHHILHD